MTAEQRTRRLLADLDALGDAPRRTADADPTRRIAWADAPCATCGRPAYVRADLRTYLYQYPRPDGGWSPAVCSPRCASRWHKEA